MTGPTTSGAALPPTHRPSFFAGQVLAAADLDDAVSVERSRRRLHNRVLHGWGIALGLEVTGARGAKRVAIGAGYALDALGRDLILADGVESDVPAVAAGPDGGDVLFCLTLRWTEDDEAAVRTRDGACGVVGAVRLADGPTVGWCTPAELRDGLDVLLATVSVRGCALTAPPDPAGRRILAVLPTPYVATGATSAFGTVWSAVEDPASGVVIGLRTVVDTGAAGFGDIPAYTVRLDGDRELSASAAPGGQACVLDGTPYVDGAEPGRMTVVVPLPAGRIGGAAGGTTTLPLNPAVVLADLETPNLVRTELGWHISWMGVEGG
ncbi:hypothetical protein OG948_49660 (plasmid) [Embleya sp. NBC_00888]|uniref:hypothetical protein n=1 Tax=Embleya sp. NBC_00888 TaxID=2975960 RepID=UPI002F90E46E|nr:hypothetical protein OG948_49660 [Embleya sp. NBC_00888]